MTTEVTRPESTEALRFDAIQLDDPGEVARSRRDPRPSRASLEALVNAGPSEPTTPGGKGRPGRSSALAVVADGAGLGLAAFFAAWLLPAQLHSVTGNVTDQTFASQLAWSAVCIPLLLVALTPSRTRWSLRTAFVDQALSSALSLAGGCTFCLASWRVLQLAGLGRAPSVDALLSLVLLSGAFVVVARLVYHSLPRRVAAEQRRVMIVGTGLVANRLSTQLAMSPGVEVVGFVDDDPMDARHCLARLADLSVECERRRVDHVIVAFSRSHPEDIVDALRGLKGRLPITIVPRLFEVLPSTATIHDLGSGLPGISIAPATLGWWPSFTKRTIDVVGAITALVVFAPLLFLVGVAIRVSSPGPVILRQIRVGRDGKTFAMLKFRSMVVDRALRDSSGVALQPVAGPFPKLKNDPRVTRVGRLIRRMSIDELPQLWNVLRGEMSMVGPRPFVPDDAVWIDGWAERRHSVRPGMTGLWQVSGRNDLLFEDMCSLDHLYVTSWSLALDTRILLQTLWAVARGRGAY